MTKLAPEWVQTSDPVIRSPARYRWTTAPACVGVVNIFYMYLFVSYDVRINVYLYVPDALLLVISVYINVCTFMCSSGSTAGLSKCYECKQGWEDPTECNETAIVKDCPGNGQVCHVYTSICIYTQPPVK